jgi:rare lipoprotein A (peptidoglycan hydrolase)
MEDSVKVGRMQVPGSKAVFAATLGIVVALAMLAGTGFLPVREALAQAARADDGSIAPKAMALPPADVQKNADSIRQPSELGAVDAQLTGTRTPTVIKPKVVRAAAPAPAASGVAAPSGDGWKSAKVSWYGPGFIGNTMAGGGTLQWDSMVVAHRSLPFGTVIEFSYNGRTCTAVVRDRGPYAGGRIFDLGPGTAAALGFSGVGTVQYRIL